MTIEYTINFISLLFCVPPTRISLPQPGMWSFVHSLYPPCWSQCCNRKCHSHNHSRFISDTQYLLRGWMVVSVSGRHYTALCRCCCADCKSVKQATLHNISVRFSKEPQKEFLFASVPGRVVLPLPGVCCFSYGQCESYYMRHSM